MKIFIEDIEVPRGRRPLDPANVKALKESISQIGLQTPITVRQIRDENGRHWRLVAGRNRMKAVRDLGEERIECVAFAGDEDAADLWEIGENLHRGELTAAEKAKAISDWVAIVERRDVVTTTAAAVDVKETCAKTKTNPTGRGGSKPHGAMAKAAKELGVSKDTVQESVRIGKIAPDVIAAATAAGVASHKELLAIAKVPAAKRLERVAELQAERADMERVREERANAPAHKVNLNSDLAKYWTRSTQKNRLEFINDFRDQIITLLDHAAVTP